MYVGFQTQTILNTTCFHCGEPCKTLDFRQDGKDFCCQGCLAVYDILNQNQLCEYYNLNDKVGIKQKVATSKVQFAYLDLPEVQDKLFDFRDEKTASITLFIPTIHCSSCIWLLEHLYKLNKAISYSKINFLKKQLFISFDITQTQLSEVVSLLASIGYEPTISLNDTQGESDLHKDQATQKENRRLLTQLAVAGFVFGNVMMLSFPEYFGLDSQTDGELKIVFNTLNMLLALPALFYSGQDYLISAYKNLKKGLLHVDFPLALGMMVLWLRSLYEIFTQTGAGYLDSMTGLIFFLLVGKWFQQRTYQTLRYDRDFKSYFPIAVTIKEKNGQEKPIQVTDLQVGDIIKIRNEEIIPTDATLLNGHANIDYSFVTGEAKPTSRGVGDVIYAGGRQKGSPIELVVLKSVSQSYLTQLWNNVDTKKQDIDKSNLNFLVENSLLQALLNRYFTLGLLLIASISASYWLWFEHNISQAINVFSSVLIIACPCALSLGSQFALGTALRVLGKNKFYLKNIRTVEEIANIDTIVFDKTGTITETNMKSINFVGYEKCPSPTAAKKGKMTTEEMQWIAVLCQHSTHPLSVGIVNYLKTEFQELPTFQVTNFKEVAGSGLEGIVNGYHIKVGSLEYVLGNKTECLLKPNCEHLQIDQNTRVLVAINFVYRGFFSFKNNFRRGVTEMIDRLSAQKFDLQLISGDNDGEREQLNEIFPHATNLHFQKNPYDKLDFVANLQANQQKVMMVGDGLNDAGALLQSNVGVAVTENTSHFTPASSAILDASALIRLPEMIQFCKSAVHTLRQSFVIALLYNLIGLFFAVQGGLSPIIAAILMPVSSLTIILFTTWGVQFKKIAGEDN